MIENIKLFNVCWNKFSTTRVIHMTPRLIPESPRWLWSKGRYDEAYQIMKKMATINGRSLPARDDEVLLNMLEQKSKVCQTLCRIHRSRTSVLYIKHIWTDYFSATSTGSQLLWIVFRMVSVSEDITCLCDGCIMSHRLWKRFRFSLSKFCVLCHQVIHMVFRHGFFYMYTQTIQSDHVVVLTCQLWYRLNV